MNDDKRFTDEQKRLDGEDKRLIKDDRSFVSEYWGLAIESSILMQLR